MHDHVVVMDEDYYGTTMADRRHTHAAKACRHPIAARNVPPGQLHLRTSQVSLSWQYCVAFWSHCLRTEPFFHIIMSGSALVGALTSGTILAGLIITSSKPENPAYREASWRAYMRNLKWDSEAL